MALNMVKVYKNKALQATVSYVKDTNNCINMPHLTIEQRLWICVEYARVNNAKEVLRRWRNH